MKVFMEVWLTEGTEIRNVQDSVKDLYFSSRYNYTDAESYHL